MNEENTDGFPIFTHCGSMVKRKKKKKKNKSVNELRKYVGT